MRKYWLVIHKEMMEDNAVSLFNRIRPVIANYVQPMGNPNREYYIITEETLINFRVMWLNTMGIELPKHWVTPYTGK